MNLESSNTTSDSDLLLLARDVLRTAGFAVEEVTGEPSLIFAENRYFVVAVTATSTIAQLLVAEGATEIALAERIARSDAGPKIWDSYVVLLTQEHSVENDEASRALYEINYDTARMRRIAHIGVEATAAGMREVLAPFVAPRSVADASVSESPLVLLLQALVSHGVNKDLAARAVTAFDQGASLVDVL